MLGNSSRIAGKHWCEPRELGIPGIVEEHAPIPKMSGWFGEHTAYGK
jgi:hypothetical protein